MGVNKPPCEHCEKRHTGCHGQCEAYQSYAVDREEFRQERARQKDVEGYMHQRGRKRRREQLIEQKRGRHI